MISVITYKIAVNINSQEKRSGMVRGLYTAYTGLVNQQKRLDVVSNNLANATTTGFKKEGVTTQSFDSVYGIKIKDATVGYMNQNIGRMSLGAKIGETYRSWDQGSLRIMILHFLVRDSSQYHLLTKQVKHQHFIPGMDLSR